MIWKLLAELIYFSAIVFHIIDTSSNQEPAPSTSCATYKNLEKEMYQEMSSCSIFSAIWGQEIHASLETLWKWHVIKLLQVQFS